MPPIWYDAGSYKLYFYHREEHRRPHVAVMAGHRRLATVAVETGDILAGTLSRQQHRHIRQLLAEHRPEALAAFEAALRRDSIVRLDREAEGGAEG